MIGQNAFVDRLGDDFDLSQMLVVDFMHEFELGIWKSFFTHLIRILYTAQPDGNLVETLNEQYLFFFQILICLLSFIFVLDTARSQCSAPAQFAGFLTMLQK